MVMPSCLLANGTIVADAVMDVPSGTSSDRVTYTPMLVSVESVGIFAKWTENANRSDNVTYTIHHSVGSSDIIAGSFINPYNENPSFGLKRSASALGGEWMKRISK